MNEDPTRILDETSTPSPLAALLRAALPPQPTEADEEAVEAEVNATVTRLREELPVRDEPRNEQRKA